MKVDVEGEFNPPRILGYSIESDDAKTNCNLVNLKDKSPGGTASQQGEDCCNGWEIVEVK